LKLGRYGSFIGCSNYPACQYTRKLAIDSGEGEGETLKEGLRTLGPHPETGEEITVRRGPYGVYVQLGEGGEKLKPRRTSLPRGVDGDTLALEQAIALLGLPRIIGIHPETKEPIEAGIGRFGAYVRMGTVYGSLDRDDDVLAIGMNRAMELLAKKLAGVRALGAHPKDNQPVAVKRGRFGPYIQHGSVVANVPRGTALEDVTLDEAVALLAERGKPLKAKGKKANGKTNGKAPAKAAAKPNGQAVTAPPAVAKSRAKTAAPAAKKAPKKSAEKPAARAPAAAKPAARR